MHGFATASLFPGRFFSFFAFFDSLTSFILPFDPGKRNPFHKFFLQRDIQKERRQERPVSYTHLTLPTN